MSKLVSKFHSADLGSNTDVPKNYGGTQMPALSFKDLVLKDMSRELKCVSSVDTSIIQLS